MLLCLLLPLFLHFDHGLDRESGDMVAAEPVVVLHDDGAVVPGGLAHNFGGALHRRSKRQNQQQLRESIFGHDMAESFTQRRTISFEHATCGVDVCCRRGS